MSMRSDFLGELQSDELLFDAHRQIELLDESGQPVRVYAVFRCWPSEYQAFSDLDTGMA